MGVRGRRLYVSHPQTFDNIRIGCIPPPVKTIPTSEAVCERLFLSQVAIPAMLLIDYQMKDLDHSAPRSNHCSVDSAFHQQGKF